MYVPRFVVHCFLLSIANGCCSQLCTTFRGKFYITVHCTNETIAGHLFLSAVCGQIEALENGTDADIGASEAAVASSRLCLQTMNMIDSPSMLGSLPQPTAGLLPLTEDVLTPPDTNIVGTGDFDFDAFGFMDDIDSFEPWSFM